MDKRFGSSRNASFTFGRSRPCASRRAGPRPTGADTPALSRQTCAQANAGQPVWRVGRRGARSQLPAAVLAYAAVRDQRAGRGRVGEQLDAAPDVDDPHRRLRREVVGGVDDAFPFGEGALFGATASPETELHASSIGLGLS